MGSRNLDVFLTPRTAQTQHERAHIRQLGINFTPVIISTTAAR
jgi:hypothetical protein